MNALLILSYLMGRCQSFGRFGCCASASISGACSRSFFVPNALRSTGIVERKPFSTYEIRFGSGVYRFILAAKGDDAGGRARIREVITSFRRLSLAEIKAATPLRLSIRTVQAGDTAERFARSMPVPDRPVEHFRVLNGLGPKEQPKPGDLVKVVVE
jgi:predicted Zn-dependent protease